MRELEKQEREGKIDLYYGDGAYKLLNLIQKTAPHESGFSLVPYLPYAWQEKGEKIEVESSISKRLMS